MPTLNWIGKDKVINHHRDVPFRVLQHKYGFKQASERSQEAINNGNKIIHGDNLEALKALLPAYEGRIKCIYIDPPYNTGNESWTYNDNVNDPKIKNWIQKSVGKEGEDLSRHDKWLCMMYPRLKLLEKLLADNGAIFISIDDNEHSHLKLICDEIFGRSNYISSFVWRRRASSQMSQNNISVDHEYVLTYTKVSQTKFSGTKKDYKNYSNPDNDPRGKWTLGDLTVGMTKEQRPNQFFDLVDPDTNRVFKANTKRVWTYAPDTMSDKVAEGRVVFPKNATGRPMLKRYLDDLKSDINPVSTWLSSEAYGIGLNSEGTKILQSLFDEKIFDYPKPVTLVQQLIGQITSDDDIILDSFAGSGTTAHAVLNLNEQDGGHRKFILIEMEEYAESITAERIKRVAKENKSPTATIDFDFYTLGECLFTEDAYFNPDIPLEEVRKYIFYTETKTNSTDDHDNEFFLGSFNNTAYYLYYEAGQTSLLDHEFLKKIHITAEDYIVYADHSTLTKDFLAKKNITFKKIPDDIVQF